jgi:UDP-N-acetylglucosamine--N-acetylmuramyl-(pentapeptide) pyrophosphoryl-undecaprenol N-acetylglucosamine transferase|tara:strand:- start:464 stop:1561 length:1098 start_codon:yes stop_codon:yes gene_type:complete
MNGKKITVLIMAAGTGGHVFPALAIAQQLKNNSVNVEWLGTPQGMENSLVAMTDIPLHSVSVKGLRGTGVLRWLSAPFMLSIALFQSLKVIRKVKPNCVLGMGGFICGPAGIATKLLGKPLLIHEQNAVPGLTNKWLSRFSRKVFEAFPNTFANKVGAIYTGNPLRNEILSISNPSVSVSKGSGFNLLVIGGSQGSLAINKVIPELAANWSSTASLNIRHQTGSTNLQETLLHYEKLGLQIGDNIVVEPFINEMAEAYNWADMVICRSGASTVSELAAVGLPSILVPYPHHKDQQQLLNAKWLAESGGASIIEQKHFSAKAALQILLSLSEDRIQLAELGEKVRTLAIPNADELISQHCMEVVNG